MKRQIKSDSLPFSVVGGHIVECFDNMLYGFLAVMLAPIFFPETSAGASIIASYGVFFVGYLGRPLGALFFGLAGDKIGRKKPLLWTMMMVGVPTIIIGCTPSYDKIGIVAPLLLVSCRFLQGFFYGGEYTGANLYIAENSNPNFIGRKTGFLIGAGGIGATFATIFGALFTWKIMPEWAWRLPFIIGGVSAVSIYILRKRLHETYSFQNIQASQSVLKFPLKEIMKHHKYNFIVSALISGLSVIPLYSTSILGNKLFQDLGYSTSESLLFNMLAILLDSIVIAMFGWVADKVGFRRQVLLGALATFIIAFPVFYLVTGEGISTYNIYTFIIVLNASGCIINGAAMPYVVHLFPTNCRYSAVALSDTFGSWIGGATPLVGMYLIQRTNSTVGAAIWLCCISFITFLAILINKKDSYYKATLQFGEDAPRLNL